MDGHDGVVRIVDTFDNNSTDRHIASMLAQAVPGAVDAETKSIGNDRST